MMHSPVREDRGSGWSPHRSTPTRQRGHGSPSRSPADGRTEPQTPGAANSRRHSPSTLQASLMAHARSNARGRSHGGNLHWRWAGGSRRTHSRGTWDLAPRAMAGKGRRCWARTGGDGLARRASSSSGSGASRVGPQLPRPRRFHAPMPADACALEGHGQQEAGEWCINAGLNTSPRPRVCVSAVQMGGWICRLGRPAPCTGVNRLLP